MENKGWEMRGKREIEIGRKQRMGNVKSERGNNDNTKLLYNDGASPKDSGSEIKYPRRRFETSARKKLFTVSIHLPVSMSYHTNP